MYSIVFLILVSFASCLVLTPLVRRGSQRLGLVDRPGHRKTHAQPTPRTGGVAVALAYALPLGILVVSPLNAADSINMPAALQLLPAILVVFLVGLLDDVRGLRPWEKLLGQTLAAWLAFESGLQIDSIAGHVVPAALSLPLTIGWLLICTNAFNLIDGLDGLASGVGLFAASSVLVAALLQGNAPLALATAPLVGALAGFLRYNFNPASIFLGDSGSLPIGFALGCFGALWSQKSATVLGVAAPVIALSVPLIDTTVAIVRRFIRRQPIFSADRNHIHHRLLARGLTTRQVALVLYGACALAAAFSLLVTVPGNRFSGLLIVGFGLAVMAGVRVLGYVEFAAAQQMVASGALRDVLNARLYVQAIQARCARAMDAADFWSIVQDVGREFHCTRIRMSLHGSVYDWEESHSGKGALCTVRIPLSGADYVNLRYPVSLSTYHSVALTSVIEVLQGAVTLPRSRGASEVSGSDTRVPLSTGPELGGLGGWS